MVGEQLRTILTQTGFNMSEFAGAVKRSRWTVQRWCRPGVRVADRWVVQLALFLARKGLDLNHYYPDPEQSSPAIDSIWYDGIEPVEESKRSKANKRKTSHKKGREGNSTPPPKLENLDQWRQTLRENVRKTVENYSGTKSMKGESRDAEQKGNEVKQFLDDEEQVPVSSA